MDIKGLQFAIFGMGESGVDTAEFLMRRGAKEIGRASCRERV
jgi:UDP-N-acetylmuramoylalanine-D-glutamate ligase